MIEIRLCTINEIDKLQEFIDTDWKREHILATHTDLLKWQHLNKFNNQMNFVLAYDTLHDEIVGILGFIPLNQFDNNLLKNKDFWLAIWKVKEKNSGTGLGLELLNFITNTYQPNSIGSIGINQKVKKLYKILKYKTGVITQYYFLNPSIENFQIAKPNEKSDTKVFERSEYQIKELKNIDDFNRLQHQYKPHKSIEYLKNRYIHHPIYNYQLYGIYSNDDVKCILVTRKIVVHNSACIRIVDIYGNLSGIKSIESELVNLLNTEKCEYIDCLNFGIPFDVFLNLGFSIRTNSIIPNYFEPFEQTNVDIEFAYLSDTSDYVIFKGDSDQDRPSILK